MTDDQPSRRDAERTWVDIQLRPRAVARLLAVVVLTITVVGAIANWSIYRLAPHPDHPVADVLKRFDLGHEPSIPGFYSASMILACAVLLALIARAEHRSRNPGWGYWWVLSAGFLVMAIDEAVMFHEMLNAGVNLLFDTSGPLYFAWVIPAVIAVLILGLCFIRFLWLLDRASRTAFLASGFVYLSGAIGMELFAGIIFSSAGSEEAALRSPAHIISQAIEEGLEMAGIAMFFVALLNHVGRQCSGFRIQVMSKHHVDRPQ